MYFNVLSYLPGLLLGCLVNRYRQQSFSKHVTWTLQTASILGCLLVYWSGAIFSHSSRTPSRLLASFYAATFHTAFNVCCGTLIVSLIVGHPTWLSRLLSWQGFVPLSKLGFSLSLTHSALQIYWVASSRALVRLHLLQLISWTISDWVMSMVISLGVYLVIETPARYIVKFFTSASYKSGDIKKKRCVVEDKKK